MLHIPTHAYTPNPGFIMYASYISLNLKITSNKFSICNFNVFSEHKAIASVSTVTILLMVHQ